MNWQVRGVWCIAWKYFTINRLSDICLGSRDVHVLHRGTFLLYLQVEINDCIYD